MLVVPCEVYARPCGFYTMVSSWNEGKSEEFKTRKLYKVDEDLKGPLDRERKYAVVEPICVEVYGKENCPNCVTAAMMLQECGILWNKKSVELIRHRDDCMKLYKKMCKKYPNVWGSDQTINLPMLVMVYSDATEDPLYWSENDGVKKAVEKAMQIFGLVSPGSESEKCVGESCRIDLRDRCEG